MSAEKREELEALLLTPDGMGKGVKRDALAVLRAYYLRDAAMGLSDRQVDCLTCVVQPWPRPDDGWNWTSRQAFREALVRQLLEEG